MQWWLNPQRLGEGHLWAQLQPLDARGWGAHLEELRAQGVWNQVQRGSSSNFWELLAVREALKERIWGKEVQILADNSSTVAFLKHQGGTRSCALLGLTQELLEWAEQRIPSISAVHIKGVCNVEADYLSRQRFTRESGN